METEIFFLQFTDRHEHIYLKTNRQSYKNYENVFMTHHNLKKGAHVNNNLVLASSRLSWDAFKYHKDSTLPDSNLYI